MTDETWRGHVARSIIGPMPLLISEELLLLAFDPQSGRLRSRHNGRLDAAVAAGLLVESQLLGSLTVESGHVIGGPRPGEPLLDEVVNQIRDRGRTQGLKQWVVEIAGRKFNARARLLHRLAQAGLVVHKHDRLAGLIPVNRYRLIDTEARARVAAAVRTALVTDSGADDRSATLITLLSASGLIDLALPPDARGLGRSRAASIAAGRQSAEAVSQILRDAQNAAAGSVAAILSATVVADGGAGTHSP